MPSPGPRSVHSTRYKAMLAQLRRAREDAGLTQIDVAKALRKTQSFISKCERGERRIDPIDLADFARLYKRPFEFFVA